MGFVSWGKRENISDTFKGSKSLSPVLLVFRIFTMISVYFVGTALVVIMLTLYPSHIEANYSHGRKNCFGLNMQVSSPKSQDFHSLGKERMSAIELSAEIT